VLWVKSMNIKEMITELQKYPDNAEVAINMHFTGKEGILGIKAVNRIEDAAYPFPVEIWVE